jgi:SAM-dependent methyltransferase
VTDPGWRRLVRHSYGLGLAWLFRAPRSGWKGARVGLNRLVVPLDPWRFWEMGRVADEPFSGWCLDVSSPKLLPSLLRREGKGRWCAIDLFEVEIHRWKSVDPALTLATCDARRLPFANETFDHALTISVIEHIPGDGDARALREIFRVLKPGGILHLTTNVALDPRTLTCDKPVWGSASETVGRRVFYERHYDPAGLEDLLKDPWERLAVEWVAERRTWIHDAFTRYRPFSYLAGGLLRFVCPGNFTVGPSPAVLPPGRHGVVYLKLRRPASA